MPKIVDPEKQVADILVKSVEVLVQFGFSQISMRLLAKELGISTGTLYHYFKSKDDLYFKLLDFHLNRDFLDLQNLWSEKRGVLESIELIFQAIEDNRLHYAKQIRIWNDFITQVSFIGLNDRELELREKSTRAENQYISLLCQVFATTRNDEVLFFWISLDAILADYSVLPDELRFKTLLSALKNYCIDRFSTTQATKHQ